jgi:hypothetical protein
VAGVSAAQFHSLFGTSTIVESRGELAPKILVEFFFKKIAAKTKLLTKKKKGLNKNYKGHCQKISTN